MSESYEVGEVVNVTINGVRIVGMDSLTGHLTIAAENGDAFPLPPQAVVERLAPANWPPQPGDLWRVSTNVWKGDAVWFTRQPESGYDNVLTLVSTSGTVVEQDHLLQTYGPVTLVHRESGTDPGGCDHHGDHAGCGADCECAP